MLINGRALLYGIAMTQHISVAGVHNYVRTTT